MWWRSGFAKGEPRHWTKVHLWKGCKSISLLASKREREWRNGGSGALTKSGNDDFMLRLDFRKARATPPEAQKRLTEVSRTISTSVILRSCTYSPTVRL